MTLVNWVVLDWLTNPTDNFLIVTTFAYVGTKFSNQRLLALAPLSYTLLKSSFLINFGLQNILGSVHPSLVLLAYSLVVCSFASSNGIGSLEIVKKWVYLLGITLVLGGFWAFQEYTWGGWWNWDLVEVPLLLILVLWSVNSFHSSSSKLVDRQKSARLVILIILALFLVRYSSGSVHSFIVSANSYSLYMSLLFFEVRFLVPMLTLVYSLPNQFFMVKLFLWLLYIKTFTTTSPKYHQVHTIIATYLFILSSTNWQYFEVIYTTFKGSASAFSADVMWCKPRSLYLGANIQHLNSIIN